MEAKVELISPAIAEQFLAGAARNRPVRKNHVSLLCDAIKRGEWKINGESIVFDDKGKMIDGQHRCLAIIRSGKSVRSVVVRGAEKGSFDTIDIGVRRNNGDVLSLSGEANGAALSAMLRTIGMLDRESVSISTPFSPTATQTLALIKLHPGAREWVTRATRITRSLGGALNACAVLCLIEEKVGDNAVTFYERLASGANLSEGSAILALRHRMATDPAFRAGGWTGRGRTVSLVLRAWNAYAKGDLVQNLRPRAGETIRNIVRPAEE